MKTIEVKFPEIKGMRVSGAALDFKNGCSLVEYVDDVEFKKGDVLCMFSHGVGFIGIYNYKEGDKTHCFVDYGYSFLEYDDWGRYSDIRIATDSEKQLLFDALEKDGKYWDSEALEVKEFERVPENIGIYRCDRPTLYNKGDELCIGFNDNKQIISTSNGIYTVDLNDADIYYRVNCYLKPISNKDVKVGNTILCGDKTNIEDYFKISNSGWVFSCGEDTYIMDRSYNGEELFKLTPIK